jgi:hypothetical protein
MVLTQDPQRPREIDARIPEGLELIVQRAMAKDARDRYQSMSDLERALAGFQQSMSPVSIVPRGSVEPTPPPGEIPNLKETGARRAFDLAKAALGGTSMVPPAPTTAREAKLARPVIVVTSIAIGFWFIGGTASALGGLVRVLHDGEITVTESVLLLVGCLFATATPLGLYIAHVKKKIWPNSMRALQLATDLKRFAGAAFVSFGALMLLARLTETIFLRSSNKLSSGIWDMSLFAISVILALSIGGFGPLLRNMRRRRSSDS